MIQFTPPGSGCSVIFGKNVTAAAPGSAQGLYLVVSDIEAVRDELLGRGVKVSEVFHDAGVVHAGTDQPYLFGRLRVRGPDSEHRSYRSFASFNDPDGNGWLLQEITTRLPGRVAGDTAYASAGDLSQALRRAAANIVVRWKKNLYLPLETSVFGLKHVAQEELIDWMQCSDNQELAWRQVGVCALRPPCSVNLLQMAIPEEFVMGQKGQAWQG